MNYNLQDLQVLMEEYETSVLNEAEGVFDFMMKDNVNNILIAFSSGNFYTNLGIAINDNLSTEEKYSYGIPKPNMLVTTNTVKILPIPICVKIYNHIFHKQMEYVSPKFKESLKKTMKYFQSDGKFDLSDGTFNFFE